MNQVGLVGRHLLLRNCCSRPRQYVLDVLLKYYATTGSGSKENISQLVKNSKVVVFMKGVPDAPRCGFSNAVVEVLRMHGVSKFDSHDVLEDEALREGIKEFTNWPTVPQVFINGEFVGGCDIVLQMHQNGSLVEELKKAGIKSALDEPEAEATTEKK